MKISLFYLSVAALSAFGLARPPFSRAPLVSHLCLRHAISGPPDKDRHLREAGSTYVVAAIARMACRPLQQRDGDGHREEEL